MGALAIIMAQMRTSAPSIAILVAAALAVPASLSGCKEEQSAAKPPAQQAGAAAAEGAPTRPKREKSPLFRNRPPSKNQFGLVPLTRDEIKPIVPMLTGAVQTARPMVTTAGRQINVIHCLAQNDPAKIKAEFKTKLEALGYDAIRFRDKPKRDRPPKELVRVTAEKAPYRLTVAVQSAPFSDCKESEKKVKLVMQFFKRSDQAPAAAGTPAAPGTPASPAAAQTPAAPAVAPAPASSPK